MSIDSVEDSVALTANAVFGAGDPQDSHHRLAAAVARRDLAARTNPRVLRGLQRAGRAGGITVTLTGVVVMAGWFAGLTVVTSLAPGLASMKFDTAVGLALVGLSLLMLGRDRRPVVGVGSQVAAAGYGLLGLATLIEDATGRSLGLDNPFRFDHAGLHAGRMATTSAACLVALAIAAVALGRSRPNVGQLAGAAVVAVGTFAVIGYAFGVSSLYQVGGYAPMALHTAVAFVIAGLTAVVARPDEGFVALVTGDTSGGVTVRRMLVPALVGPAVVGGLLDWAARSGRFTSGFRLAVFTIAMMVLSGTLVWVIAASLRRVDVRRAGAEDAFAQVDRALADRETALGLLRHSDERTRRILNTARDAFVSVDDSGLVEGWNRAAEDTFGWPAHDAVGRRLDQLIVPKGQRTARKPSLGWMTGAEVLSNIGDHTLELTALHRNGSEFPVELTVWAIDQDGRKTFNAFVRDVTVRKTAEASTARLAAIVEHSGDAILAIDPNGRILSWNKGAEHIYGYRAEEMIGVEAAAVLAPAGSQADRDALRDRLEAGGSTSRELTLIHADGHAITVSVTSSPILDADGSLVAVSSISRDITDQKAAQRALADSEANTKTSLDNMLDGFAILRAVRDAGDIVDFEFIYINPAGAASYGHDVAYLVGARLLRIFPGIGASGGFDEFCHVVNTGQVRTNLQAESPYQTFQGVFDSQAWKLDDGFAFTWRDVTDRETALAAVRSNEERFRASVEHLHEALSVFVAVRDDTGAIVDFRWDFANSAASEITGYSPSELAGRTLMDVLPHHGPSGMLAVYRNIVETGEPYVEPSLWYEDVWGDGRRRRRAFDVRATKLDDGFVVVTREVTDEREHEEGLTRQRRELERSNTEMKHLNALADMLQSCATSDEAYSVATQSCAALFSEFSGSISIMQPTQDFLDPHGSWGNPPGAASFAATDCWALRRGRPHVSGPTGPRCRHLSGLTALRCLCVPMMGTGETTGVFHLLAAVDHDDDSTNDDLEDSPARRLAVIVAGQLSMAFANLGLRDSLREMSIRDPLTGLFNRRYMTETLTRELSRAVRTNTDVGILVIDVDHFKAFNDTHGHDAGDAILEAVGQVLIRYSRTSDVACRYGGEEFIVILPNCSLEDSRLRADELRRRVSSLRVPYRHIELSGPTISCGIAGFPHHGTTGDALIHTADRALYTAKHGGRDQVVTAAIDETSARVAVE